jgi:hypothetical protein
LQLVPEFVPRFAIPLPLLEILSNPAVQAEFELDQPQQATIRSALEDLSPIRATLRSTWEYRGPQHSPLWNQLARKSTDAVEVLNESVPNARIERLRQVLLQFEIARVGMLASMCLGSLQRPLSISRGNRKKLHAAYFAKYQECQAEILDHQKQTIDALWNCLTPAQQAIFKTRICDKAEIPLLPLIWLQSMMDLRMVAAVQWQLFDPDATWHQYAFLPAIFNMKFASMVNWNMTGSARMGSPSTTPSFHK